MARTFVPAAEELLDKEVPVLNHGFVRLVDYMGGDQRVVQAARVSYGQGTKTVRQDRGLIHYLMRNFHTSPFEQVQLTFHCKMPIFVARQWVRHRTARLNEISGRYSVMVDEFYLPKPENVCYQSEANMQGRSGPLPNEEAIEIITAMSDEQKAAYKSYQELLNSGVARELARVNLPNTLYTQWYWQIDLHNLFHFLKLRMDPHAQYEIRVYAEAMAKCAMAVAPFCYEAFEEYVLESVTLSRKEQIALSRRLKGQPIDGVLNSKELVVFEQKLARMETLVMLSEPVEDFDAAKLAPASTSSKP